MIFDGEQLTDLIALLKKRRRPNHLRTERI